MPSPSHRPQRLAERPRRPTGRGEMGGVARSVRRLAGLFRGRARGGALERGARHLGRPPVSGSLRGRHPRGDPHLPRRARPRAAGDESEAGGAGARPRLLGLGLRGDGASTRGTGGSLGARDGPLAPPPLHAGARRRSAGNIVAGLRAAREFPGFAAATSEGSEIASAGSGAADVGAALLASPPRSPASTSSTARRGRAWPRSRSSTR